MPELDGQTYWYPGEIFGCPICGETIEVSTNGHKDYAYCYTCKLTWESLAQKNEWKRKEADRG